MTELEEKIQILQKISKKVKRKLEALEAIREKAKEEMEGAGLTVATCEEGAAILREIENGSRKLYTGTLSVHQSMADLLPEGMNEGQKPWPP